MCIFVFLGGLKIEIKGVSFKYSKDAENNSLENLGLTINDGEVVLLCGKSGCGKTTITRLLNGLIPHYYEGKLQGEVIIDTENISNSPLHETAKKVGSVFQNPRTQFFTVDSTSELAFACENQGLPENEIRHRILTIISEIDIKELLGKNLFHLSGGEKQKIACGAVATAQPNIIILDEPSSNLDIMAIRDLQKLIKIWKNQGKTIVIAEHRLYYLMEIADKIIYLENGKVQRCFTPKELLLIDNKERIHLGLRTFDMGHIEFSDYRVASEEDVVLKNFIYSYTGKKECLNLEELRLPQNQITAIIGHNGAGKSTFARCLCGIQNKFAGIVENSNKVYNSKHRIKNCYMVMQDVGHQLFTESVLDEVLIGMKNPDEAIALEVLSELDLLQLKDVHPKWIDMQ